MLTSFAKGTIIKGSNVEISVVVAPCCETLVSYADLTLDFYTTPGGNAIHKTYEDVTMEGTVATLVLQKVELDTLDDGVLRFTSKFANMVYEFNTSYYIQTPVVYTPVDWCTKEYVDEAISAVTAYSAGTGIDITNNIVSVSAVTSEQVITALTYTPYDSANPDGYTKSTVITDIWTGTQAQYDAITAKSETTLYLVHES